MISQNSLEQKLTGQKLKSSSDKISLDNSSNTHTKSGIADRCSLQTASSWIFMSGQAADGLDGVRLRQVESQNWHVILLNSADCYLEFWHTGRGDKLSHSQQIQSSLNIFTYIRERQGVSNQILMSHQPHRGAQNQKETRRETNRHRDKGIFSFTFTQRQQAFVSSTTFVVGFCLVNFCPVLSFCYGSFCQEPVLQKFTEGSIAGNSLALSAHRIYTS